MVGTEHLIIGAQQELAETQAQLASANRWISELVNDLSEARAQIRNIDHAYGKVQRRYEEAVRQRDEARAQIAAKDAALRWCREYLRTEGYARGGLVITQIDAALATPARET